MTEHRSFTTLSERRHLEIDAHAQIAKRCFHPAMDYESVYCHLLDRSLKKKNNTTFIPNVKQK